jgi:C-terminal processing protease CtpA/Prc
MSAGAQWIISVMLLGITTAHAQPAGIGHISLWPHGLDDKNTPQNRESLSAISVLARGPAESSRTRSKAVDKAQTPVLSRAEMEADLAHLTLRVKRAWAYAEDKRSWLGVDIDALHAAALCELDQVQRADDFYFIVKEYVAGLMDGHAGVRAGHSSPGLSNPWRWPFTVTRLEGRFFIKTVEGNCEPLEPGDQLLSVNGLSLSNRFENALARSTGSTVAGREYRALGTMRGGSEKQLRIEAVGANGSSLACAVTALPDNAAAEEPIRWKRLEGDLGYLRLPSFRQDMRIWESGGRGPTALQAALAAKKDNLRETFSALKDTRGLILDLRGNGGGSDALGHFLAHFLCDTKAHPVYYSLATRDSEDLRALPDFAYRTNTPLSARQERSEIRLLPEPDAERYHGKLAVLMDEGCFSACDCFVNYLAVAAPETIFVGRPNGAGAGAPRPVVTLPHSGMVVTFCVMQVWNLNNRLIEGRPLTPTIPVRWTAEDLRRGGDPDLEASIRALSSEMLEAKALRDAGQTTPEAAMQTYLWAITRGDTNRLADLLAVPAQADPAAVQRLMRHIQERAAPGLEATIAAAPITTWRILGDVPAGEKNRWVLMELVGGMGTWARVRTLVRPTEAGWRFLFGTNQPLVQQEWDRAKVEWRDVGPG